MRTDMTDKIFLRIRQRMHSVAYLLVVGVAVLCGSCSGDEKTVPPEPAFPVSTPLEGTKWKLAGIADVETGVLTKIVPTKGHFDVETGRLTDGEETFDCEKCYTLAFESFKYYPSIKATALQAYGWSMLNEVYAHFFEPIQIS